VTVSSSLFVRPAWILIITAFMTCAAVGQAASTPTMERAFETDNCTWFPDGDYTDCCVAHDKEYFVGGGLKDRLTSDERLRACVLSKGKGWKRKLLANTMFLGVRVGGVHFLPAPFRWGFGNKWPRMRPPREHGTTPSH